MAMALSRLTVRISWCGAPRGQRFIAQSDECTEPRLWFRGGKIMIRKVWNVNRGPWPCSGPIMKINSHVSKPEWNPCCKGFPRRDKGPGLGLGIGVYRAISLFGCGMVTGVPDNAEGEMRQIALTALAASIGQRLACQTCGWQNGNREHARGL